MEVDIARDLQEIWSHTVVYCACTTCTYSVSNGEAFYFRQSSIPPTEDTPTCW